jgi:hypothetical protein
MKIFATAAAMAHCLLAPALRAGAQVQVAMRDGTVSLTAKDATVRQILAEWARVGQTKIINGDAVAGGPITLQLANVPEEEALDIILRSVSGYLAAPRGTAIANASRFDRIMIMAASAPVRAAVTPAPAPAFPQARARQPAADPDDDDPPPNAPPPAPPLSQQRAPVFNTFPPPIAAPQSDAQTAAPAAGNPASGISAPFGVAVPGMIVQPPQEPGQPGAPQRRP